MDEFLKFLAGIGPVLIELFNSTKDGSINDQEKERQLSLNMIRSAKDTAARMEIEG